MQHMRVHWNRPIRMIQESMDLSGERFQKEALDLNLYHWQNGNICIWCSRQRAGWGNAEVRELIRGQIQEHGRENLYKFILTGKRDPDIEFDTGSKDRYGNILEIVDETIPDYDFEELWKANQENLIGKYIEAFGGCETGSVEYEALCEGIQALMANRQ